MIHAMNELPYPGYAAERAALDARVAAADKARAAALPGPMREAFAGEPRHLYGQTLQPVTAGLEAILTRIDSPLLPTFAVILASHGKPPEEVRAAIEAAVKPAPDALIETAFCFTRPARELRGLLDKGRLAFREAAMDAIGDKLNQVQLALLYKACSEHYAQCFVTAISYEAARSETDGTVFTQPPAETTTV